MWPFLCIFMLNKSYPVIINWNTVTVDITSWSSMITAALFLQLQRYCPLIIDIRQKLYTHSLLCNLQICHLIVLKLGRQAYWHNFLAKLTDMHLKKFQLPVLKICALRLKLIVGQKIPCMNVLLYLYKIDYDICVLSNTQKHLPLSNLDNNLYQNLHNEHLYWLTTE